MAKGAYIGVDTKVYSKTVAVGDLAVGSTVKINENGTPVDYIIVHQGNPDTSMYDASCNGTWLLRKTLRVSASDSNVTNWGNVATYNYSNPHTYLNGTFMSYLDSSLQNSIKNVKIPYKNASGAPSSSNISKGSNGLSVKAFLLSWAEVGKYASDFTSTYNNYPDGAVLDYFKGSNVTTNRLAAADNSSSNTNWWLRSAYYASAVFYVSSYGIIGSDSYTATLGIRPCFIVPFDLSVTNGIVTGATTERVLGNAQVGSTIQINENGSPVDYIVVHRGNPDPSMYDASCDGIWVLRKDIHSNRAHHSSHNIYSQSNIHNWMNLEFLPTLDTSIQSAIAQVKIPYVDGYGNSGNLKTGADGLSTKVFLLSGCEIGFSLSSYSTTLVGDGSKLDYFSESDNNTRIAYLNGSAAAWWCRTPNKASTSNYFNVTTTGAANYNVSNANTIGARPAFILPSSLSLTNNVVTGTEAPYTTTSVARKIKDGYIGVPTGGVSVEEISITESNMSTYFNVEKGSATFTGSGTSFSSTTYSAYIKFTALNTSSVTLNFTANSFNAAKESFTVTVKGSQVWKRTCEDGYPASSSWSGVLNVGEAIEFQLSAKGNIYTGDGIKATFSIKTTIEKNIPIQDLARKIKKAYIGIGGVARPFWGEGKLEYYGTITSLSESKYRHYGVSIGNYALFAGGLNSSGKSSKIVNAYDASLTISTPTSLSYPSYNGGATSVGNYALIASGINNTVTQTSSQKLTTVNTYNTSLTKSTATAFSAYRNSMGVASNSTYALFAGGHDGTSNGPYTNVTIYNTSLTRSTATALQTARCDFCGATIGDYILFAGGDSSVYSDEDNVYTNVVDAYNTSLTRSNATALSTKRGGAIGVRVGNYLLFAGGGNGGGGVGNSDVDVYDTSLTKTTTSLGYKPVYHIGVSLYGYAIFAGGYNQGNGFAYMESFDSSLTRTRLSGYLGGTNSPTATVCAASATVGNYALIAGGTKTSSTTMYNHCFSTVNAIALL